MNSFILVHNDERLIVDPGHSYYRSLLRGLDTRTRSHSTCTFHVARADAGAIGGEGDAVLLEQSHVARRRFDWTSGLPGVPVDRGGRRLLAGQWGELVACGSEVSALYGWPMEEFSRFWFLCGSHVLFVVDVIRSKVPVRAEWSWLLDHRDGKLEVSRGSGSDVMVRRGESAMLLHCGGGEALVAEHAFVHDAYDPLPGGPGEGRCGSGLRLSWRERRGAVDRVVLHGMAMDVPWRLGSWACAVAEGSLTLRCEAPEQFWTIRCPAGDRENLELLDGKGGGWRIVLPRGAAGAVRVDSFGAD